MGSTPQKLDPKALCKLVIKKKFAGQAEVETVLKEYLSEEKSGKDIEFGAFLVKRQVITAAQAKALIAELAKTEASKKPKKKTKRVGNFEIICKIGEGGMGTVYKARQIPIDREVALKILPPDLAKESDFQERFFREARAVAKFNHPNIVAGIDVGKSKGVYYFAMEYIAGQSLGQILQKKGKLPEKEALDFARQTALALQHAHKHHLLHRDVKPDNILVDSTGVAKLADLGLVRTRQGSEDSGGKGSDKDEESGDAGLTRKGKVVGTPYYISPEQARGKKDLTPGTDLYSLGATLFHLLVGQHPFPGSSGGSIMRKHVKDPVPDPRKLNPKLSTKAAEIVMRLMQKDPKDRYVDGKSLAAALADAITDLEPKVKVSSKKAAPSSRKIIPVAASANPKSSQTAVRGTRVHKKVKSSGGELLIGGAVVAGIALIGFFLMKSSSPTRVVKPQRKRPTENRVVKQERATPKVKPKKKTPKKVRPAQRPKVADPVRPEEMAWQPKPVERNPNSTSATQRVKVDPVEENKLMLAVNKALKEGEFESAEKKVDRFLQASGRLETVRFSLEAIAHVKALDKKWKDAQGKLEGAQVTIKNMPGKVTRVNSRGFLHDLGGGASQGVKWDAITGQDRLRLMGYVPNEADTIVEQGIYLYVRGDTASGAKLLLDAHANGKLKNLPDAWKKSFEAITQEALAAEMKVLIVGVEEHYKFRRWLKVIGGVETFRKKFGAAGEVHEDQLGAYYREARNRLQITTPDKEVDPVATINPDTKEGEQLAQVEKKTPKRPKVFVPPSGKFIAAQFRGRVEPLSGRLGHIKISYDFSRGEQEKDFSVNGAKMERRAAMDLRLIPGEAQRGGLGGVLVHKARWMGDGASFKIFAEVFVIKAGGGFGTGIREGADGTGKFGVIMLGGGRGVSGKRLYLSQIGGGNQNSTPWNYKGNAIYRCLLKRYGEYWEGRMGEMKQRRFVDKLVGKQKRKELPGEFAGHGIVFTNGAQLIIRRVNVEGYLHPEYIKELTMGPKE